MFVWCLIICALLYMMLFFNLNAADLCPVNNGTSSSSTGYLHWADTGHRLTATNAKDFCDFISKHGKCVYNFNRSFYLLITVIAAFFSTGARTALALVAIMAMFVLGIRALFYHVTLSAYRYCSLFYCGLL
jgi:hypothetical protein